MNWRTRSSLGGVQGWSLEGQCTAVLGAAVVGERVGTVVEVKRRS